MNPSFISNYFKSQRNLAIVAILFTVPCIGAALFFFAIDGKLFYTGMAWPLILAGTVILIPELRNFFSARQREAQVMAIFDSSFVNGIRTSEIPAIRTKVRVYAFLRWIEFVSQIAGLVIILSFKDPFYWKGFGAGLFMMASFALVFHFFAERKTKAYLDLLVKHDSQTAQ